MIARAHIVYLGLLAISSFLRLHSTILLHSSIALMCISLHRSLLASLMMLILGSLITQSPFLLGSLWLIAYFFRSALYVKYERPWPILIIMSFVFFVASILFGRIGSLIPGLIAFIFLYHGAFITQKELWASYKKNHNPKNLLLFLGMALPLALLSWKYGALFLIAISLGCLSGIVPISVDLHFVFCFFAWSCLSLQNTPSFFMGLCLWIGSLCIAYKGLHYDFQRIKSPFERPSPRIKHNHRTLSFGKKFSSFRLS